MCLAEITLQTFQFSRVEDAFVRQDRVVERLPLHGRSLCTKLCSGQLDFTNCARCNLAGSWPIPFAKLWSWRGIIFFSKPKAYELFQCIEEGSNVVADTTQASWTSVQCNFDYGICTHTNSTFIYSILLHREKDIAAYISAVLAKGGFDFLDMSILEKLEPFVNTFSRVKYFRVSATGWYRPQRLSSRNQHRALDEMMVNGGEANSRKAGERASPTIFWESYVSIQVGYDNIFFCSLFL